MGCCKKMDWKNRRPLPVIARMKPLQRDKLVMINGTYEQHVPMEKTCDRMIKNCTRGFRVPLKAYKAEEVDTTQLNDVIEMAGFLDMLLRVADVIFTEGNNVANDFNNLMTKYILPNQQ